MREIVCNKDDLSIDEITEVVNRVKILLINDKNELLLGCSNGVYQFIGGHVEKGESFIETVIREVKEETGITLSLSDIEPFMVIKYMNKDWPKPGINRLSGIYYFVLYNNQEICLDETCYTEKEEAGGFRLEYISLENIEQVLEDNIINNDKNRIVVPEMLGVLQEYKNNLAVSK